MRVSGRIDTLRNACAEDLRLHNPPLSLRFIEEWDVTPEEFDALCDMLARAVAPDVFDAALAAA